VIRFFGRCIIAFCLAWFLATPVKAATEPPWGNEPFGYVTVEQDLTELLREFASQFGIPITVSSNVFGVVRGRLPAQPPRQFLDNLARLYGLLWYYDGFVLHISGIDEAESQIIRLDGMGIEQLTRSLEELGVLDARFPWRVSPSMDVLYVSGPPRYVELIRSTAQMLDTAQTSEVAFRVFKLRYAQADDRTYTVRGSQVLVPGLAAMLRQLVGDTTGDLLDLGARRRPGAQTVTRVWGDRSLQADALIAFDAETLAIARDAELMVQNPALRDETTVQIQSDPRTNSVVIRDLAGRMPIYERLIEELDRPQRLIEVEVVIADITADRLQDIGVDWRINIDTNNTDTTVGVGNPAVAALAQGLSFATAISGDPFSVLARIRALEEVGDARVISRPAVLTFDNVEAAFDQNQTFYVRLEGNEAVELVEIEVGLLLQVRPHVVETGGRPRVRMNIQIEDGVATGQNVDDIPVLQRSTLTTQGMVQSGQALVIGGFYRQQQIDNLAKVPLLGDIPVIGWLFFTNRRQQNVDVTRLFVIRPLVIDEDPEGEVVTASLPREGPRDLVPPERRGWLTPEGSLQRRQGKLGLELDDRITRRSLESLCLVRSMQNDPCPPGLIQLLSDVQLLPPRSLEAEPGPPVVTPGELY
jgi:type III secretion protein C